MLDPTNDPIEVHPHSPHRSRLLIGLWAVLAIAWCLPLLFPGDAPWINDEPALIARAMRANRDHKLAEVGLLGTAGRPYGPLPVWIYQLILHLTNNPFAGIIVRALAVTTATSLSLLCLAKTFSWRRWFGVALMFSPYLWLYSRQLWDNSFNIPLCAVALALYAYFLARGSRGALAGCCACMGAMLLVHLMALAFVVPLLIHLLLTSPRIGWRKSALGVSAFAIVLAAGWKYWHLLLITPAATSLSHPFAANSWLFGLLGSRLISAAWLGSFFDSTWQQSPPWVELAKLITLIVFPLTWFGIALAFRPKHAPASSNPSDTIVRLCAAIVLTQTILSITTGTFGHPHYYNATWIAYALLAWSVVQRLNGRIGQSLVAAYGVCLAIVTGFLILRVHQNCGTRDVRYGTTLGEQLRIVNQIKRFGPDSEVFFEVRQFQMYPQGLLILSAIAPPQEIGASRRLHITYATTDPQIARLRLVEEHD